MTLDCLFFLLIFYAYLTVNPRLNNGKSSNKTYEPVVTSFLRLVIFYFEYDIFFNYSKSQNIKSCIFFKMVLCLNGKLFLKYSLASTS